MNNKAVKSLMYSLQPFRHGRTQHQYASEYKRTIKHNLDELEPKTSNMLSVAVNSFICEAVNGASLFTLSPTTSDVTCDIVATVKTVN